MCRICQQSLNNTDVAYCSEVCKSMAKGNTFILKGSYWGITPVNQQAEIKRRLTRNY